jgi:hypothetical protein
MSQSQIWKRFDSYRRSGEQMRRRISTEEELDQMFA